MGRFLAVLLVAGFSTAALAQEPVGCDKFKWPLEQERAMLSKSNVKKIASGGKLEKMTSAVEVTLVPFADAKLPVAPERAPKDANSFAGFVRVARLRPAGRYKISLSGPAWIDVVRDKQFLKSIEFSGAQGCEGIRKSVKFDLPTAPILVQVSAVPTNTIRVVITRDK